MAEPMRFVAAATISRFLRSNARIRGIKGPFGSGKSSACVVELLSRSVAQKPLKGGKRRTRWAVIRNTYRELEDTTRQTFEKWIREPEFGRWKEKDFTFELRVGDVEADILFRALDKPADVKKLLSLDLTGAYINEAREIPKHIFDALDGRIGRYPSMDEGGPTWFGTWLDSNPWEQSHWLGEFFRKVEKLPAPMLQRLGYSNQQEYAQLFRQPGGREANAENLQYLPRGYYESLCIGKDQEWIDVYVDGRDAKSAVGSIYGDLITALEEAGNICEFDHGLDGVFTSWDLGRSDATAIWFWRVLGRDRIEVIDYYENHFQPLSHYFDVVDQRGYSFVKHFLPHDAKAKTLATELSVEDQCRQQWPGKVEIGPSLGLLDGIAATRWLLEGRARIHARCAEGVNALRAYRRKWDDAGQVFLPTPVHDWASNGADAARYMAVVVRGTELLMRPPPTPHIATPEETRAIAWLKDNPNHPQAQKVAEYLESKGLYHAPKRPTLNDLFAQQQRRERERV